VLLNVCCAPCSLPIIDYLIQTSVKATLFFYGPNIFPAEEYEKRLSAVREVAQDYQIDLFEGGYDHAGWLKYIKQSLMISPESYAENGERCLFCYRYRLKKTAEFAKENLFDAFAATLSVSRFKDTDFINHCAADLARQYGLDYRTFPLDPGAAHQRGRELSKKLGVYRQKYCGCEYSLR
jgi:predicted adenine nucleotide alpha hydrolase (AANH) superfamily ATPase